MRTLLVTIRFKGGQYCGYQVQKEGVPTVSAVFQQALEQVVGHPVRMKGCSRTDAGVHARQFCISFATGCTIPAERLPMALNRLLPGDIAAIGCREVAEGFHARYDARGKRYIYRILNSRLRDPFWEGLAWWVSAPLAVGPMQQAAKLFVGRHDFSAFCGAGSSVEDHVRTVWRCQVQKEGEQVVLAVEGDGFLYHMVRIMAGTLVEIGRGSRPVGSVAQALAGARRCQAGMTAPAWGLYLDEVFYGDFSLVHRVDKGEKADG